MTDRASVDLFEWLNNTPSMTPVSPRPRTIPAEESRPREPTPREWVAERISEHSSRTLRRSRTRQDTERRRSNGVFRHRGGTYRPNYDLAPDRRRLCTHSPRQETRYRPYSNDQNTTREVDMGHLQYEYDNASQYSNYHSFTRDYCADSRDSHPSHYESHRTPRYESHRTPRYSSDPAPVDQYPYYSESHAHFYESPAGASQPRPYHSPRHQDDHSQQNFDPREEYDRYYEYLVRTDTRLRWLWG